MELLHPDDRDGYVSAYVAAADARQPFSAEARFRHVDGEYRWFLMTGTPRVLDGAYQGHVGTGLDITDLKRAYEERLIAQKLESVGLLAAGVAHDFNNLLGAIVVRADSALSEMAPGAPAVEDVDRDPGNRPSCSGHRLTNDDVREQRECANYSD